ncbi:hypothetical protein HZB94_05010 [Candidatus Falkowbacteria bacterium]|nr:hypothetical protein [Candidatus Falkowbacteria bacterium]
MANKYRYRTVFGEEFDLGHLHPTTFNLVQDILKAYAKVKKAKGKKQDTPQEVFAQKARHIVHAYFPLLSDYRYHLEHNSVDGEIFRDCVYRLMIEYFCKEKNIKRVDLIKHIANHPAKPILDMFLCGLWSRARFTLVADCSPNELACLFNSLIDPGKQNLEKISLQRLFEIYSRLRVFHDTRDFQGHHQSEPNDISVRDVQIARLTADVCHRLAAADAHPQAKLESEQKILRAIEFQVVKIYGVSEFVAESFAHYFLDRIKSSFNEQGSKQQGGEKNVRTIAR